MDQRSDWLAVYQAALLEVDPAKLPERIERACKAIQMRMDAAPTELSPAERQALTDAWANLRVLRREAGVGIDRHRRQEPESPASEP